MLTVAGIYPSQAGFEGDNCVGFKLFKHRHRNKPGDCDGIDDLIKTSMTGWGRHSLSQWSNLPNISTTDHTKMRGDIYVELESLLCYYLKPKSRQS